MRRQILVGSLLVTLALFSAVAFSKEKEHVLKPADSAARALVKQLGDQDFSVRKKAETKLLDLGEKAVPALEDAAKKNKDANIRYEAQRLLAEIRGKVAKAHPSPSLKAPSLDNDFRRIEDSMNQLLKELQDEGLLDDNALSRIRDMLNGPLGAGPGSLALGATKGEFHGTVQVGALKVDFHRFADGRVKVVITRDGKAKSYEADSMADLLKTEPDVYHTVTKYFGNVRIRTFSVPLRPLSPNTFPWPHAFFPRPLPQPNGSSHGERPLRDRGTAPPGGFRLGVWIGEISAPLRAQLGLEKDQGILVSSVVSGSLADRIGVQRYDVILDVNGQKVTGVDSVRAALRSVPEGGKVTLTVIRKAKTITLLGNR